MLFVVPECGVKLFYINKGDSANVKSNMGNERGKYDIGSVDGYSPADSAGHCGKVCRSILHVQTAAGMDRPFSVAHSEKEPLLFHR